MNEHEIARMEGKMARAIDEYFAARPDVYSRKPQKIYEDAFQRAWRELLATTESIRAENSRLKEGLIYYAEKNHLMISDILAWDTVSGEPENFLCDEAGTATVEDGEVARQVLAGNSFDDDGFVIKNNETTTNPT